MQQLLQNITQGYETIARQTTSSSSALSQSDADGLYASSLRIIFLQIKSFFSQLARQRVVNLTTGQQIRVNKRYLVAAAMQGAARREATGAMQR